MDLRKLLEILEERQTAYRRTWTRMKRSDRIIVVGLIVVGLLNIVVGSVMLWR